MNHGVDAWRWTCSLRCLGIDVFRRCRCIVSLASLCRSALRNTVDTENFLLELIRRILTWYCYFLPFGEVTIRSPGSCSNRHFNCFPQRVLVARAMSDQTSWDMRWFRPLPRTPDSVCWRVEVHWFVELPEYRRLLSMSMYRVLDFFVLADPMEHCRERKLLIGVNSKHFDSMLVFAAMGTPTSINSFFVEMFYRPEWV